MITLFMFIAGTNMAIIYFALKRNFKKITGNNELIFYIIIILIFSLIVASLLNLKSGQSSGKAISDGIFHVVSIVTTTGFYTQDFNLWGSFLILIIFILMFTGGMAGSASGSIKILRLLIIAKNNRHEFRRLIHPNAYVPVRIDKKAIPENIVYNLLIFITLYFIIMCIGTLFISFMGYDIVTSLSTSASILGNIGPGLGAFGPFSNYADIPVIGKWFLSALMLVGRLELLAVIILFTRGFYKR